LVFFSTEMQAWICLCILFVQVFAIPPYYVARNQRTGVSAVPPSRHGPVPAYPSPQDEPIYPPAALPGSLLSLEEQVGAGVSESEAQIPAFDNMIPGYIPTSTPFDNPTSSLSTPVKQLPATPECSIRPQTVTEIQRMRESASKIAVMMQQETVIMNRRKTYVEQMTNYLNDRIVELNKVKSELAQETKWLDLSSNRIYELEEKEKLVKLQDIQSCLNDQTTRTTTDQNNVGKTLTDIQSQQATVQASIAAIEARMNAINAGASGASTGS